MVSKANLVAFTRGINNVLFVQIEQVTTRLLVVDFTTSFSLVLANDFATVFGNEFFLLAAVF